jgi:type I restriction enzyme R subunit
MTNSISWTAHFQADLHGARHNKLFDSVLVVSDRTMLDAQLQETISDFERTTGVVATITNEHGSKSAQLGQVLKAARKSSSAPSRLFRSPYSLCKSWLLSKASASQ